ncbi:MAG: cupin domain-containing protein [Phaeodactylibacter sp.]|nr:cupin domain-containing protein [Phaeodactylibacter sp.]
MHKFIDLEKLPERELAAGFSARLIHTGKVTIAHVKIRKGSQLPAHKHFHEQVTNIVSGELEMTVGGETVLCRPGMSVTIPSNVLHSARALSDCYAVDVFCPEREDYK